MNDSYKVGDVLRMWIGTSFDVWKVTGVHLGGIGQESLVSLRCLSAKPGCAYGKEEDSLVPLVLLATNDSIKRV